jgi:hypothetical protein
VGEHRFGALLSLVRQGVTLGLDFGSHSLEAMLSVAETVENSVVEPDSLARSPGRLSFSLANPPLRTGAFSAIRVRVDGAAVPPDRVFLRTGAGAAWQPAAELSRAQPWRRGPGERTEFRVAVETATDRPLTVRLEFDCIAIPPLVWIEFTDTPRTEAP